MKMCRPAEDCRDTCEMGLLGAEEAGRRSTFNLTGPPPRFGSAAATRDQKLSSPNQRALLFHCPGGAKAETRVSAEVVPSESREGRSVRVRFSPRFLLRAAFSPVPSYWLPSLCLSSRSPLLRTPVTEDEGPGQLQGDLI